MRWAGPWPLAAGSPDFSEAFRCGGFNRFFLGETWKVDETCQPRRCERYGAKSMGFFCFSDFLFEFRMKNRAILRSHFLRICVIAFRN